MNEIQFILYSLPDEEGKVQVVVKDDTLWCTQKAMAQLFGCTTDNIGLHLKNIFKERELEKDSVTEKISATASDGKNYLTQFYQLDAIIAVGYRVSSVKATKFRQWATKILNEYIKKGFVMDDERLKQGQTAFGKDYFRVNEFLSFRRYQLLPDKGRVSKADADAKAEAEYDIFNKTQKIDSDFDKAIRGMIE